LFVLGNRELYQQLHAPIPRPDVADRRHAPAHLQYNVRICFLTDPTMPIDGKLLEILCCPVSKTPLIRVSATRLKKLNEAIAAGELLYVGGETVEQPLREALVTDDSKVVYPVVDGIPVLLEQQGIGTTQLQDF
jgi:uncharacterized protein YbaR (Trm112 family)